VFQDVVNDLTEYLQAKNIVAAKDEFAGKSSSESDVELSAVQRIARDSGATHLLYFYVERPVTKWLQVTARCYDMAGKQVWEEQASSWGGVKGSHGLHVTLDTLHKKLDARVGGPGLPIATPTTAAGQ
jgi:aconitase A